MNEHEPKINRIMDSTEGVVTSQENSSKTVSSPIADNMEKQVDVEGLKNKIKVFKEQLGKFVEKSPDSSRALRDENKIKLYKSIGKNEEAKKIQLEIARREEDVGHDWLAAPLYEDAGEKGKAKECWEKRLKKISELLDSAEIYEKLGDTKKSQEKYREFIKSHENEDLMNKGNGYSILRDLAISYEKLGDTETAKTMWGKVAEKASEDFTKYNSDPENAGEAYDKAGDKEKAVETYKKAIAYYEGIDRKGPKENSFHLDGLVKSYWALSEKSKAIQELKNRVEEAEKYRRDGIKDKMGSNYEARHGKIEEGDDSDAVFNSYEDLEKYLNKYIAESSK